MVKKLLYDYTFSSLSKNMVAKLSDMLLCGSAVLVWDSLPTDTTFPFDGIRVFSSSCPDRIYDSLWNSNTAYTKVNSWCVELFKSLILALCFFSVFLPMYAAEKRAAAAARKRFILDPFSDHLVFVQVFRVSWLLLVMQGWCVAIMKKRNIWIYF